MKNHIRTIAFDADDTLWVNEPYYRETEAAFASLLAGYLPEKEISNVLFEVEMQNMPLYGYGAKAFMLSLVETALKISNNSLPATVIDQIIRLGKKQIERPIKLLDDVPDILSKLHGRYRLVMATKGDLLDQERKLKNSNLTDFFHHIEVMSDKKEANYVKLIAHLDIEPEQFLMIGNSMRSDVLPVLKLGSYAIHVPYHMTWQHERIGDENIEHERFIRVNRLKEICKFLK